jgi:hypothetical protein
VRGIEWYASRALGLAQTQPAADTPCVSSRVLHGLGFVLGNVLGDVLFSGGIHPGFIDTSQLQQNKETKCVLLFSSAQS